jgi:hypothetical protein
MHVDSRPEWIYVIGSSAGIDPGSLHKIKMNLMLAAMAHYEKTHCLLVIDREGESYEVGLMIRPSAPCSPIEHALGDRFFGNLRMTDNTLTLIPNSSGKAI